MKKATAVEKNLRELGTDARVIHRIREMVQALDGYEYVNIVPTKTDLVTVDCWDGESAVCWIAQVQPEGVRLVRFALDDGEELARSATESAQVAANFVRTGEF